MIVNEIKNGYKVIRRYKGLKGDILVEEYEENGIPEYHVKYEGGSGIGRYWTRDKLDAIIHAQFIAARY